MSSLFRRADILLPQVRDLARWAVIACDQYTSLPSYWQKVRAFVGKAPSTLNMILPEACLFHSGKKEIDAIHTAMVSYYDQGLFREVKNAYIYVERTLENGLVRKGIVGMIDLEGYDYALNSTSPVRASEQTVKERLPAREAVRQEALLELPHVIVFADDYENSLIERSAAAKLKLAPAYESDLMMGGGSIKGWIVSGQAADKVDAAIAAYETRQKNRYPDVSSPVIYAVGDGNHSLACAKACYEQLKKENPGLDFTDHPARYALIELANIHDPLQVFEPIHRVLTGIDAQAFVRALKEHFNLSEGIPVRWFTAKQRGTVYTDPAALALSQLQPFLDEYIAEKGAIDYVHEAQDVISLADNDGATGLLMEAIANDHFFHDIAKGGSFPRKTFSIGRSADKRYYLEARLIKSL